jgi:FKBP-type peptidyl-prolyl cis-trans isomerase
MRRIRLFVFWGFGLLAWFPAGCGGGLKTVDLIVGDGPAVKTGDVAEVHYTLYLASNRPIETQNSVFRVGSHPLEGWNLGIPGMKVGGKRKLIIPPALAYGAYRQGNDIPANAELIFDVELLRILPEMPASPSKKQVATFAVPPNADPPSGLKIEDLKDGIGQPAKPGDRVQVLYRGTLLDGKEFDSNRNHDAPFVFTLGMGQVIKGWDKGVVGMKPGGKRKLTIPPDLAYGNKGRRPKIPPNTTLVFEIELLRIGA